MVAPLLGMVADRHGVETVLWVLEAVLLAALLLSLTLPRVPRLFSDAFRRAEAEEQAKQAAPAGEGIESVTVRP
jgi:hypothetical protein